jgi:hypothetical protein
MIGRNQVPRCDDSSCFGEHRIRGGKRRAHDRETGFECNGFPAAWRTLMQRYLHSWIRNQFE